MNKRNKIIRTTLLLALILALAFSNLGSQSLLAAAQIRLVIDGKDVTSSALPVIENDRTLVPIRIIAEQLGAKVTWNEKDRTVLINKDSISILLRIDSHLIEYQNNGKIYSLSDVPPKIINDRTFVPLRLVSNALGIGTEWAGANRVVYVDSKKTATFTPFFDMKILGVNSGQVITGKTDLQVSLPNIDLKNATEIKYLLLDPETAQGIVVGRGSVLNAKYNWIPNLQQNGERVLVAAIYDEKGNFLAGDSIPVFLNINPKVSLTGISQGQTINDTVSLGADINFVASYIKYEITNLDKNKTTLTTEADPQGSYNWTPQLEDNGNYALKVIAYDENNKGYESEFLTVRVDVSRRISLAGIASGQSIDKPVSLLASRNFSVTETEYILRDINTGAEQSIAKIPYGSYKWFPGPELQGTKEVFVRVKDPAGIIYDSSGIKINLSGKPKLLLEGIGPKQVVAAAIKLKTNSNIKMDSINYIVTNTKTGSKSVIASGANPTVEFTYTPSVNGDYSIQAEGIYNSGSKIYSEQISYKVFLGKTYGAKPIIEKSQFLGLASGLARNSWEKTGMSAALQTAQAILETGWGQSVPVDKYSGKLSNNLFGIKGKTNAGSVISNTWEEYNGTTFRIDAEFRAYNNINDSWNDHKSLLLEKERYGIFRDVMYDSTLGAWAIRRAGYATDSQYPIKLMKIIKDYDLQKLDRIGI